MTEYPKTGQGLAKPFTGTEKRYTNPDLHRRIEENSNTDLEIINIDSYRIISVNNDNTDENERP